MLDESSRTRAETPPTAERAKNVLFPALCDQWLTPLSADSRGANFVRATRVSTRRCGMFTRAINLRGELLNNN
jgi:hypothetical protein